MTARIATPDDIGAKFTGDSQPRYWGRSTTARYLRSFVVSQEYGAGFCAGCGLRLGNIMGAFVFGIQHWEGHCCECGWPGRAIHHIHWRRGLGGVRLNMVLQYRRRDDDADDAEVTDA